MKERLASRSFYFWSTQTSGIKHCNKLFYILLAGCKLSRVSQATVRAHECCIYARSVWPIQRWNLRQFQENETL